MSQARVAKGGGQATPSGGSRQNEHLSRYLDLIGLRAGASLDEINTAYYTVVKRFPENPTEEDEARMQELRRAYEILRRAYVPPKQKSLTALLDRRLMMPVLGMVVAASLGSVLYLNRGTIRLKLNHYEPGVVLRLNSAMNPFGTVVGYEAQHRFAAGAPGAAYEIRLDGRQETVWVSERIAVNGMTKMSR
jgi:hypothetical protein